MRTKADIEKDIYDVSLTILNLNGEIRELESVLYARNIQLEKTLGYLDSLHTALDDFNQNTELS